jgi:hypothetical protein
MRYHWGLAVGHNYVRQHLQLLKCSVDSRSPDTGQEHRTSSDLASGLNEEYEVETIMASQLRRGKLQYLVHWKGYPHEEDTWEPEEHLSNSADLVRKFHRDNPSSPSNPDQVLSENEDQQSSRNSDQSSEVELERGDDSDSSGIGTLD